MLQNIYIGVIFVEEKYLNGFIETVPCLMEVYGENFTVAVIDMKTMEVIINVNGKNLQTRFETGTKTTDSIGSFAKIVKNKKQFISLAPNKLFGVPAKGILTPVVDKQGNVVAIVIVVKNLEVETKIEEISNSVLMSMKQLNIGIEEITSSSQQLSEFINETVDFNDHTKNKINEITDIIQVIKNISSQSNLLALNASIEAARAKEAGKGFSVVANEMKKLSIISKESAEKVTKTLIDMKNDIETITQQINKTSENSDKQAAATEEISAMASEMFDNVELLSDMLNVDSFEKELNKN